MILLTTTSDKLQLVTNAAGSIAVYAAWLDNASGTITPDSDNLAAITSATTTDVIAAPGSGVQRNIKTITCTNTSTLVANRLVVQHTDGVTAETLWAGTLQPGEAVIYNGFDFVRYNAAGVMESALEQWFTDRVVKRALAKMTFTPNGLRSEVAGTVTVNGSLTTLTNLTNLGLTTALGRAMVESQTLFQSGFRRNLTVA